AAAISTTQLTARGARANPSRSRGAGKLIRRARKPMTAPCFVDASVFLYARDPRDPVKQTRAAEWIDWLWQQRAGRTSMQVLAEFHAAATRHLGLDPDLAWDEVKRYLAWTPLPTDEALLRGAREVERRYRLAWWDSMAVAAAQLQDCAILASDELPDGTI